MIKICISVTSHALDPPPPVTNCHTFSDPLPLERDVLYGRPLMPIATGYLDQSLMGQHGNCDTSCPIYVPHIEFYVWY